VRLPNWLFIQRTALFLYLAAGVLLLIYALGFISNVYIFYAYGGRGLVDFYHKMQEINDSLLWKAIFTIIFTVILFLLELGKHPAGIVTFIVTVVIAGVSVFFCVDSIIMIANARSVYSELDLASLNRYIERGAIRYEYSTLTYDLGLGGYILFLLSSLFMAITVIRNALTVRAEKGAGA